MHANVIESVIHKWSAIMLPIMIASKTKWFIKGLEISVKNLFYYDVINILVLFSIKIVGLMKMT